MERRKQHIVQAAKRAKEILKDQAAEAAAAESAAPVVKGPKVMRLHAGQP